MAKKRTIENLKPVRSENEARELGKKGGIASGIARREKRDMAYFARLMLDEVITDKKGNELPTRYAMLKSVLKKVLKDGDVQAFKTITAQAGEQPQSEELTTPVVVVVNTSDKGARAMERLKETD
ncbi:MAG: hypothetical protein IIZ94_08035 [Prevotella sp.]|nr:hypothetical protein [Prevotella sp.]